MISEKGEPKGVDDIAVRGGRNVSKTVAGYVIVSALVVTSGVVIPRTLGVEAYGQFAAIMAVVAILQVCSTAGLQQVEARYLAPEWQLGDRTTAHGLASSLLSVRFVLSAVAGVISAVWLSLSPRLGVGVSFVLSIGALCFLRSAFGAIRGMLLPIGYPGSAVGLEVVRVSFVLAVVASVFPLAGIKGVFLTLPVLYVLLVVLGLAVLPRAISVIPINDWWKSIRPYSVFAMSAYVGTVSGVLHTQLSVFILANWVVPSEAAFLAIGLQVYSVARGGYFAFRRALMPLLSELDSVADLSRLCTWGEAILRYSVTAACLVLLSWACFGRHIVAEVLTEPYMPAYGVTSVLLFSFVIYCWGATFNGLLIIRERAGLASTNLVVYVIATLIWVGCLASAGDQAASMSFALAYVGSSLIFAGCTYLTLRFGAGISVPCGRSVALSLPALLAWPIHSAQLSPQAGVGVWLLMLTVYLGFSMGVGLIPVKEGRWVIGVLVGRRVCA